jgi:hypothetical protein
MYFETNLKKQIVQIVHMNNLSSTNIFTSTPVFGIYTQNFYLWKDLKISCKIIKDKERLLLFGENMYVH